MKKFEDYYIRRLCEKLFEHTLHFEQGFVRSLQDMRDNPIAKDLISLHGRDNKDTNINFIDIDLYDDSKVSFVEDTKIDKKIEDDMKQGGRSVTDKQISQAIKNDWTRQSHKNKVTPKSMKIGRVAQRLSTLLSDRNYKASDVETFVNRYIALQKEKDSSYTFELLKGKDISDIGYDRDYYEEDPNGSYSDYSGESSYESPLHTSCMVNKESDYPGILELYDKNENVNLLIMKKNGNIVARALVWYNVKAFETEVIQPNSNKKVFTPQYKKKENSQTFTFMDRIYYLEEFMIERMRLYAARSGWAFRKQNSYSAKEEIIYKGSEKNYIMFVDLNKSDFRRYPYMDTFTFIDDNEPKLSNCEQSFKSYRSLGSTSGDVDRRENVIDYLGNVYYKGQCYHSKKLNIYIHRNDRDLISVNYTNNNQRVVDYALKSSDNIIYINRYGAYFFKEDVVLANLSGNKKDYILTDEAFEFDGKTYSSDDYSNEIIEKLVEYLSQKTQYEIDELRKMNGVKIIKIYRSLTSK